ncbi:MAG: hypothetical protein R3C56_10085 [Pirellulaceae bacterium]
MLDKAMVDRREMLSDEIGNTQRSIANLSEQQLLLKNTINTSQQTMHQLLDLQRLVLRKVHSFLVNKTLLLPRIWTCFLPTRRKLKNSTLSCRS